MDDSIKKALSDPRVAQAVSKLTPEQSRRLDSLLADPQAAQRMLATPQAQRLLKKLTGEEQNG